MAKSKFKKALPLIIVLLILASLGITLWDAYKKSKPKRGWINGLRESLRYYKPETDEWLAADGWQEEMNQFVRNQAELNKFHDATIQEVVEANIQYTIDTSKPLWKLFLK